MSTFDRTQIRDHLFHLLFGAGNRASQIFDTVLLGMILISVLAVMVESSLPAASEWSARLRGIELALTILFTIEYALRIWCHPQPLRYARSAIGLIDFFAIFPTYLALLVPGWEALAVLRVLRVLRIFRMFTLGRFSRAAKLIAESINATRYQMGVFLLGALMTAIVMGSLQFLVEGPENGFSNIPMGIYWALTTLTTLGNSELLPTTHVGRLLASITMMLGYAFIAIPIGILVSEVMVSRRTRNELLAEGESSRREYKSSAFFSHKNAHLNPEVLFEASVLKPVAGFLNANGGTLLIGVDDDGKILGIQADLALKSWDLEKYVRTITSRIGSALGVQAAALTSITTEKFKEGTVCAIEIFPSGDPVYLNSKKYSNAFFVRVNNSTRELLGPDMVSYINRRWS